jgi:hypothetical protein
MKVSHYKRNYGDGDYVNYVVFPSGAVMFESDCSEDWEPSRYSRDQIEDHPDFEFIEFIEAPCMEQIK